MDTLSRDSGSSNNNIIALVGAGLGAIALILGGLALVKISKTDKIVAGHTDEIAKIGTLENEIRSVGAKSDTDMKNLRDGVQNALTSVGTEIGAIRAQVAKLEEAKKAPPAAKGAKGGGGTVDASGNYAVAKGDTIKKIAGKFGTTVDAIEAENPGLDPTKLKTGQKIKIPKK